MTGEVSLRGGILPIGGLPEKLMAAQRAGITKILIRRKDKALPYYTEYRTGGSIIRVFRPKTLTFGDKRLLGRITMKMNQWAVCRCFKKIEEKFDIIIPNSVLCSFKTVKDIVDFINKE